MSNNSNNSNSSNISTTNQLGAPLPTKVPRSCVEVPFLPLTSVLVVSWAHSGLPESSRAAGEFANAISELPVSTTGRYGGSSEL